MLVEFVDRVANSKFDDRTVRIVTIDKFMSSLPTRCDGVVAAMMKIDERLILLVAVSYRKSTSLFYFDATNIDAELTNPLAEAGDGEETDEEITRLLAEDWFGASEDTVWKNNVEAILDRRETDEVLEFFSLVGRISTKRKPL